MARPRRTITFHSTDTDRIPDAFIEGTVLLDHLRQTGKLAEIGERIRIRRKGGFVGLDIVILLFVYFASDIHGGIRTVWDKGLGKFKVPIAAVADRRTLSSPPAVSRALSRVELGLLRGHTDWLLGECAEIDEVMLHPASATWDTLRDPWHVFDLDPKVLSLRHRALKVHGDRFNLATLHVYATIPPDPPPRPRLVAIDEGQLQRRRKTWTERLAWNALPDGAEVRIRLQGGAELRAFVEQWSGAEASPAARGA